MDKFSAAVSGFFWGSVVTAASCFLLYQVMGEKKENKRDSFEVALATSSKRSMRGGLTSSDQVNFLSDLVGRLWVKIGPAIGQTIKDSVEPILKESLPGPLSSIHFTRCDFGKVPIRFDNIHVHPVEDDIVKFDLDVVWDGACDIELRAKAIKLGVKNMKLFGRMQFIMNPLSDALPCFGAIQYAFINSPVLELDFTGLANVADFGGVDKKIRVILDDIIASLMVLPTRMMYKMDVNCDYRNAFFPPLGVARITAVSGRGFKVESGGLRKDVPDVYLKIKVGASPEWKTTVQQDNLSPKWNETGEFLLSDMDQIVT
jgi:Ca2+-dependent lipid-binding protein